MTELFEPKNYFDFVRSFPVSLIHFWADWNAYDIQMKERLEKVELLYLNDVHFGSVNVDEEKMLQICKDVKIINLPALVFYKNGNFVETVIGLTQPIEEKLNFLIEN